jgi:circadian clock protein KaiB
MSTATAPDAAVIDLCLFVADSTPRSVFALENLRALCELHLAGRYQVEVIDLVADPEQASIHDIVAIPTLVKRGPGPPRRVIGDLDDAAAVLTGLDLFPAA